MKEYETGAVRDTGGKGRMDLLPWSALIRISRHMEDALTHYPERNWEEGLPMHTMIDSAFRHLAKYVDGRTDEDHLCAATTNLLMAMWTEEHRPEMMDIPTRERLVLGGVYGTYEQAPICSSYDEERKCCRGTRECDPCKCEGNRRKCDFYEEVRNESR